MESNIQSANGFSSNPTTNPQSTGTGSNINGNSSSLQGQNNSSVYSSNSTILVSPNRHAYNPVKQTQVNKFGGLDIFLIIIVTIVISTSFYYGYKLENK